MTLIGVDGPFGVPGNISGDGAGSGGAVRWGPNSGGFVGQFDFQATPSLPERMPFEIQVFYQWLFECWRDGTGSGPPCVRSTIGDGFYVREFTGTLPTRTGDSAPLEPVVGVESRAWSEAKQLYR
jgi:hypothetical protein